MTTNHFARQVYTEDAAITVGVPASALLRRILLVAQHSADFLWSLVCIKGYSMGWD